jgi:hypothetical protein
MDRTVQSVPDRFVIMDRIGPDRDRTRARPVSCLGPVQRWTGSPFTRKWTMTIHLVRTHGPDRITLHIIHDM